LDKINRIYKIASGKFIDKETIERKTVYGFLGAKDSKF